MRIRTVAVLVSLFIAVTGFSAQALKPSASTPLIDGKISPNEYSYFGSAGGIPVGASLSADGSILSLAVQATTSGWVAMGLGTNLMDGAYLIMGYEANGKAEISEQIGAGHFHSPAKGTRLLKSAVHNDNGTTVLEFQVKVADFVKGGHLPFIVAYGRAADFVTKHQRFGMGNLTISK